MSSSTIWQVGIKGDQATLELLAQAFTIAPLTISRHGTEYFMGDAAFSTMSDARLVRERAQLVLASIAGSLYLRLGRTSKLVVDHVVRVEGDQRNTIVCPSPAVVVFRAVSPMAVGGSVNGEVERATPAAPVADDWAKAATDPAVAKALRLWDLKDIQLRDLSNILEIIREDGFALTGHEKRDAERVDASSNHPEVAGDLARHGVPDRDAPPEKKRVSLSDGKAIVARITRRWIDSK